MGGGRGWGSGRVNMSTGENSWAILKLSVGAPIDGIMRFLEDRLCYLVGGGINQITANEYISINGLNNG